MKDLFNILNPLPNLKLVYSNRSLLKQLVKRIIAAKYQGAALGILWNLIHPLMMLTIYTYVFSVVFKSRWGAGSVSDSKGAFAVILFCGMAVYSIFSESVSLSANQIITNPNYVKKVVFPLPLLPLSQVLASFVQGLIWVFLLLCGAIFIYGNISWSMLLLPVVWMPLFLFTLGISYFVSSLSVYCRDTPYVLQVIMQVLFFITPIFYPISAVPEKLQFILKTNPLTMIIEETRKVLLYASMPDWNFFAITLAVGAAVFILGFAWFNKTQKGFADVL